MNRKVELTTDVAHVPYMKESEVASRFERLTIQSPKAQCCVGPRRKQSTESQNASCSGSKRSRSSLPSTPTNSQSDADIVTTPLVRKSQCLLLVPPSFSQPCKRIRSLSANEYRLSIPDLPFADDIEGPTTQSKSDPLESKLFFLP